MSATTISSPRATPAPHLTGTATWLRYGAAVAVLAGGAFHARLAHNRYGTHDLITLFFLNGIGSAVVAAWIVYERRFLPLVAGLGVSSVSLLAFGLSRVGNGVVGFRGTGLEPSPDAVLTLVFEGLAVVLLAAALVGARDEIASVVRRLRA